MAALETIHSYPNGKVVCLEDITFGLTIETWSFIVNSFKIVLRFPRYLDIKREKIHLIGYKVKPEILSWYTLVHCLSLRH